MFDFIRIPRELYTKYDLTPVAREVYGLLRNRHGLSEKSGRFRDWRGVYIYFDQRELAGMLNVSEPTVRKAMKELIDAELISSRRQGQGKPNKIYVYRTRQEAAELEAVRRSEEGIDQAPTSNISPEAARQLAQRSEEIMELGVCDDDFDFEEELLVNFFSQRAKEEAKEGA